MPIQSSSYVLRNVEINIKSDELNIKGVASSAVIRMEEGITSFGFERELCESSKFVIEFDALSSNLTLVEKSRKLRGIDNKAAEELKKVFQKITRDADD